MLKSLLVSGLVGALVVTTGSLAYSKTPNSVPQIIMAQASSTGEIPPEELQQFVQTLKQLREVEVQAQQQMAQAVQSQGLTPERFMEILGQNQQNPDSQAAEVSGDEKEKFDQALTQVRGILREAESQKLQVLQAQGMEPERFNQIIAAVQEQPSLQQQVQQLLQN